MNNTASNIAILTTAADLVRCLVAEVAGNEIADAINNEILTPQVVNETCLATFSAHIKNLPDVNKG